MRSLIVAFVMYSKFPMPRVGWKRKALSWALCWFPLVGLAVGTALWLQLTLAGWLGFDAVFTAALTLLLPIVLGSDIHLDDSCGTYDILSSRQDRERKPEIPKDSHIGVFAIICCELYLLVFFAARCKTTPMGGAALALALGPAFSRSLSGLFAVIPPNVRGTGLLATFTGSMDAVKARGVLAAWAVLTRGTMVATDVWTGLAAPVGADLTCVYYVMTARRQFDGVTSDLAESFLQLCELGIVFYVAVGQRLEVLL